MSVISLNRQRPSHILAPHLLAECSLISWLGVEGKWPEVKKKQRKSFLTRVEALWVSTESGKCVRMAKQAGSLHHGFPMFEATGEEKAKFYYTGSAKGFRLLLQGRFYNVRRSLAQAAATSIVSGEITETFGNPASKLKVVIGPESLLRKELGESLESVEEKLRQELSRDPPSRASSPERKPSTVYTAQSGGLGIE